MKAEVNQKHEKILSLKKEKLKNKDTSPVHILEVP
jgi:hypothetical protein